MLAKPASEAADVAVEKAERKQLPSVDLEVLFEYKSAELTPAAVETLTTLGRALTDERLAAGTFLIGGHTDAKGSADYNLQLSQKRAEAVRQFLIATFAIDANRLTAGGFRETLPQEPAAAALGGESARTDCQRIAAGGSLRTQRYPLRTDTC